MKKITYIDDNLTESLLEESKHRVLNEYEMYYLVEAAKFYEKQSKKEVKKLLKESEYRVLTENELLFLLNEVAPTDLSNAITVANNASSYGVDAVTDAYYRLKNYLQGNTPMRINPAQPNQPVVGSTPWQRARARMAQGWEDVKDTAGETYDKFGNIVGGAIQGAKAVGSGVNSAWNSRTGRAARWLAAAPFKAGATVLKGLGAGGMELYHNWKWNRGSQPQQQQAVAAQPKQLPVAQTQRAVATRVSENDYFDESWLGDIIQKGIDKHKRTKATRVYQLGQDGNPARDPVTNKLMIDKNVTRANELVYDLQHGKQFGPKDLKDVYDIMSGTINLGDANTQNVYRSIFTNAGIGTGALDASLIRQKKSNALNRGNLHNAKTSRELNRMSLDVKHDTTRDQITGKKLTLAGKKLDRDTTNFDNDAKHDPDRDKIVKAELGNRSDQLALDKKMIGRTDKAIDLDMSYDDTRSKIKEKELEARKNQADMMSVFYGDNGLARARINFEKDLIRPTKADAGGKYITDLTGDRDEIKNQITTVSSERDTLLRNISRDRQALANTNDQAAIQQLNRRIQTDRAAVTDMNNRLRGLRNRRNELSREIDLATQTNLPQTRSDTGINRYLQGRNNRISTEIPSFNILGDITGQTRGSRNSRSSGNRNGNRSSGNRNGRRNNRGGRNRNGRGGRNGGGRRP